MQTQMRSRTHVPDSWYQLFRGCKAVILLISVTIWDHVSQINHDPLVEGVAYLVENSGDESSGRQQVHELLFSLQPCDKVRTFKSHCPKCPFAVDRCMITIWTPSRLLLRTQEIIVFSSTKPRWHASLCAGTLSLDWPDVSRHCPRILYPCPHVHRGRKWQRQRSCSSV